MDPDFWHKRWQERRIGFHEPKANPALVNHFHQLSLAKGARLFLPLCGKTLDISWLLARGFRVVGVELSRIAVLQLFEELGVEARISSAGKLQRYAAENIDIYCGDIFDLSGELLGEVDAVYDRAALVALPASMRGRYTAHLMDITNMAPQLLITFVYDQSLLEGPPFSVIAEEVERLYGSRYGIKLLERKEVPGGLKGQCAAEEDIWLLTA